MHNSDHIGMSVEAKMRDMMRDAKRERLVAQVQLPRRSIIWVRFYRFVLSLLAHRLTLSGKQLQQRAEYVSGLLNTPAETNIPVRKT